LAPRLRSFRSNFELETYTVRNLYIDMKGQK
jgi:hypothetical protein